MKTIAYLSLGGTIGMMGDGGRNVKPRLGARDLLDALQLEQTEFTVECHDLMNVASAHLGFADLLQVAELLHRLQAGGVRAAVISQGSDSLEETALLLDLFCPPKLSLVMTCAMLNPALGFSDGPENLRNSFRLAHHLGDRPDRDGGCRVVFGERIFDPVGLRKAAASGLDAFAAPPEAIAGRFLEGEIHYRPVPRLLPRLPLPDRARPPKVGLLRYALDLDAGDPDAGGLGPLDGLVVEGMGGGHVSPAMADALARIARDRPVVLTSRTCHGPTLHRTYGYAGGEIDLLNRGLIHGGPLDGLKARILLVALLWCKKSPEEIRACFARLGAAEAGIATSP